MSKSVKYRPVKSVNKDKMGLDIRYGDLLIFVGRHASHRFDDPVVHLCDAGRSMIRYMSLWRYLDSPFKSMPAVDINTNPLSMFNEGYYCAVPYCLRVARINYKTRRVEWLCEEYRKTCKDYMQDTYEKLAKTIELPPEVTDNDVE